MVVVTGVALAAADPTEGAGLAGFIPTALKSHKARTPLLTSTSIAGGELVVAPA